MSLMVALTMLQALSHLLLASHLRIASVSSLSTKLFSPPDTELLSHNQLEHEMFKLIQPSSVTHLWSRQSAAVSLLVGLTLRRDLTRSLACLETSLNCSMS